MAGCLVEFGRRCNSTPLIRLSLIAKGFPARVQRASERVTEGTPAQVPSAPYGPYRCFGVRVHFKSPK